jgi:hypothetical protein
VFSNEDAVLTIKNHIIKIEEQLEKLKDDKFRVQGQLATAISDEEKSKVVGNHVVFAIQITESMKAPIN